MITLYIVFAIIVIGTIVVAVKERDPFVLCSLFIGLPFGLLIAMVIGMGVSIGVEEKVSEKTSNIRSISDGSQVSGSFFLGSGSISDEPVYFYYYEVGPGAYRQGYVPSDKTTIVEKADATPSITTTFECPTAGEKRWSPLANDKQHIICDDLSYEFVVPNGTIVPNYVLDTSAQ